MILQLLKKYSNLIVEITLFYSIFSFCSYSSMCVWYWYTHCAPLKKKNKQNCSYLWHNRMFKEYKRVCVDKARFFKCYFDTFLYNEKRVNTVVTLMIFLFVWVTFVWLYNWVLKYCVFFRRIIISTIDMFTIIFFLKKNVLLLFLIEYNYYWVVGYCDLKNKGLIECYV